jgi:hypothetical protein
MGRVDQGWARTGSSWRLHLRPGLWLQLQALPLFSLPAWLYLMKTPGCPAAQRAELREGPVPCKDWLGTKRSWHYWRTTHGSRPTVMPAAEGFGVHPGSPCPLCAWCTHMGQTVAPISLMPICPWQSSPSSSFQYHSLLKAPNTHEHPVDCPPWKPWPGFESQLRY